MPHQMLPLVLFVRPGTLETSLLSRKGSCHCFSRKGLYWWWVTLVWPVVTLCKAVLLSTTLLVSGLPEKFAVHPEPLPAVPHHPPPLKPLAPALFRTHCRPKQFEADWNLKCPCWAQAKATWGRDQVQVCGWGSDSRAGVWEQDRDACKSTENASQKSMHWLLEEVWGRRLQPCTTWPPCPHPDSLLGRSVRVCNWGGILRISYA